MQNILYSVPYLTFFCVVYFCYLGSKIDNYTNYVGILLCDIIAIIFIGCRGYIQADWLIYTESYDSYPVFSDGINTVVKALNESFYEKGFILFNILCKSIYDDYLFFQFVNYLFEIIILHFFFVRYVPRYYILGFMLYFVVFGSFFSIIMIRNAKSMMLFMLSIRYIEDKKPVKYFIINIIGLLFHASAIFYFPLYFFINKKANDKLILLLYLLGLCIFFLQLPVATNIILFLSGHISGGRYYSLIKNYMTSSLYSSAYGISIGLIERVFSFFLIFHFRKKMCAKYYIFLNCFYIYSLIAVWFSDFQVIFGRVGSLFSFSYCVLYPDIYSILRKKTKWLFLFVFLIYSLLKLIIGNDDPAAKYENVFTGAMSREQRRSYIQSYNQDIK